MNTRILANLNSNTVVNVMLQIPYVLVLDFLDPPTFFRQITNGSIISQFNINTLVNRPLYPLALLQQPVNQSVNIPINTSLGTAVEFPLTGGILSFPSNFIFNPHDQLVYTGSNISGPNNNFKLKATFNITDFTLTTFDESNVAVHMTNLGMAIGIGGHAVTGNNFVTEVNEFTSSGQISGAGTAGPFAVTSAIEVQNTFSMHKNDRLSILFYANNIVYTETYPSTPVCNFAPPAGSYLTLTGNVTLVIE